MPLAERILLAAVVEVAFSLVAGQLRCGERGGERLAGQGGLGLLRGVG